MKRARLLLLLLTFSVQMFAVDKATNQSYFNEANAAYQDGKYENALELYLQIDEEYRNFAFEYNLGNTYYKLDSIGKSILHYERAKSFDPRDENLKVNLQLANQKVVDKIEALPSLGVKDLWTNLTALNTLGTWTLLSLIAVFFSFGCFIWVLITRSQQIKRVMALTGTLFLLAFIGTYMMARTVINECELDEAIIMKPKLDVKGSPSEDALEVFLLHEGTKVSIRNEQNGWYEISIANGNVGWVPANTVAPI